MPMKKRILKQTALRVAKHAEASNQLDVKQIQTQAFV
jgi:hypothetical protein